MNPASSETVVHASDFSGHYGMEAFTLPLREAFISLPGLDVILIMEMMNYPEPLKFKEIT
jgi:hypothetical protein